MAEKTTRLGAYSSQRRWDIFLVGSREGISLPPSYIKSACIGIIPPYSFWCAFDRIQILNSLGVLAQGSVSIFLPELGRWV